VIDAERKPSVVVGISTRNRTNILRKAIASGLSQSYSNLRILVIDDASSDDTPAVRNEFPNISWERFESQQGYVRVRNRIIFSAPEDYYVSLDDDAWFLRGDEIAIAIDFLQAHPKIAAVAYDIVSPDQPTSSQRGEKFFVSMFIGCGHVLRLSAVKTLGGYSEFPSSYGVEEKDLCLRLIDAGYDIVELQGVEVWHDKTTTARDLVAQQASGVCNDLAFTLSRVPLLLLFPMLSYKVVLHLWFAIRGGLVGPCLKGFRDFSRAALGLWHNRHSVRIASLARYRVLAKSPKRFGG
jgi:glycosyltransferase involved in cell wall biosynthesis